MKMRFMGFLAFALLSVSILSYGVNGSVFADEHDLLPVNTSSDLALYSNGSTVTISGNLKDYDASSLSAGAVTYVIITPDESGRVGIGQLIPNSDGTFEFSFIAGGPLWKTNGDYIVETKYGGNTSTLKINYVGGEAVVDTPVVTCASNQNLVNGVCVDKEPEPPVVTCASNQNLVNGVCVDKEPEPVIDEGPSCGPGTEAVNGICQVIKTEEPPKEDGGCLIATAAYGTELAPQVQFLREIRDNTVMSTASGTSFMTGFNQLYYSFSPTIADMERENPMFREAVKVFITPMISTLSIMTLADNGSEAEVLGLGISVIALNLGMYIAAPALIGFKVNKHFKSRK